MPIADLRLPLYQSSYVGVPREKDLNLQLPGSEPGVLPVELSLMDERLDSNQQPEAYEAPALPLSYAPEASVSGPRPGIEPGTCRLRGDRSAC